MKQQIQNIISAIGKFIKENFVKKNEDLPFYILILIAAVVFIGAINLFVELTDEILEESVAVYDNRITDYVLSFRSPDMNIFFKIVTDMGGVFSYVIATTLVAVFLFRKFRNWTFIIQLVSITILSTLSMLVLKRFIGRERPNIEQLVIAENLSYPSGHAMTAMAFYGFLIYLAFQIKIPKWVRWPICTLFAVLILLIGISRIYLGVHYPTDIAGGFIAGLIWLSFCIVLFNIARLYRKKKARKDHSKDEENLEE